MDDCYYKNRKNQNNTENCFWVEPNSSPTIMTSIHTEQEKTLQQHSTTSIICDSNSECHKADRIVQTATRIVPVYWKNKNFECMIICHAYCSGWNNKTTKNTILILFLAFHLGWTKKLEKSSFGTKITSGGRKIKKNNFGTEIAAIRYFARI